MMNNILSYRDYYPNISSDVFVASNSRVIGDVTIERGSSVWFSVTIRGDVNKIRIGSMTNIQDGTVIHVTREPGPTDIGNNVTIGHSAVIHACKIQNSSLIGMGSCLLDGVEVQEFSMVAAGSLVTPGKIVPSGQLWAGRPAKFMRDLKPQEIDEIKLSASHYNDLAMEYLNQGFDK